jgi:hypothetical protein
LGEEINTECDMKNKSFIFDSPLFVLKKTHICPNCSKVVRPKKIKKIVNSKSAEAKNFDFSIGDCSLTGDVEFSYYVFYCDCCGKEYEIKDIKYHERQSRENEINNSCDSKFIKRIKLFLNRIF